MCDDNDLREWKPLKVHRREEGWQLIESENRWYLIPAGFAEDFRAWEEWTSDIRNSGSPPSINDYESMRIFGTPQSLVIFEYKGPP